MVSLDLYTFLISLATVNGILLTVLLLSSNKLQKQANQFLGLTLLFYTLPVIRVIIQDTGFFNAFAARSFYDVELLYGLGPSLYLYVKSSIKLPSHLNRRYYWHYLPLALEVLYYLTPAYRQVKHHIITWPANTSHWLWLGEQAGAIASLLIYLYLTIRCLSRHKRGLLVKPSPPRQQTLNWLGKPVRFYTLFWLAWLGLRAVDVSQFGESLPIDAYYPLLILLSFTSCWIGFMAYTNPCPSPQDWLASPTVRAQTALLIQDHHPQLDLLSRAMKEDHLYLNPQLSLTHLAQHVQLNPRLVSKVLNEGLGKSFYDFVNAYRIEAVKQKLADAQHQHLTFLGIAFESGFNSKATFNHLFKKHTGMTPKQYAAVCQQTPDNPINSSESMHSDDSSPDDA